MVSSSKISKQFSPQSSRQWEVRLEPVGMSTGELDQPPHLYWAGLEIIWILAYFETS